MKIIIPVYIAMLAVSFWLYFQVEKENDLNFEHQLEKSRRLNEIQKTENNEERSTPTENVEYCSTCGAEITGAPYEAFARKYCDMRCYADDPDM